MSWKSGEWEKQAFQVETGWDLPWVLMRYGAKSLDDVVQFDTSCNLFVKPMEKPVARVVAALERSL